MGRFTRRCPPPPDLSVQAGQAAASTVIWEGSSSRSGDVLGGRAELVFALFDLLGLRFIPRFRDAASIRLYLLGAPTGLAVDTVLRVRARPQLIRAHYDDMLRTSPA